MRISLRPGPILVGDEWGPLHGSFHCTIQISPDVIIITGGMKLGRFLDKVTRYQLGRSGNETGEELTSMSHERSHHACATYRDAGGQQVPMSRICIRVWKQSQNSKGSNVNLEGIGI